MSDYTSKPSVSSMEKLMRVLDCFTYQQPEISAAEIGRMLDLPPATLYRHLQAMEEAGFIQRSPVTHLYSLGLHLVELAGVALSRYEVRRLGQVNLDTLSSTLGMNANMSVLYECDSFHLSYSICESVGSSYTILGRRSPATQTAMGRMLLSYLPEKEWKALVRTHGLRPLTPCSFQTLEQLENDLVLCRSQGYAIDRQAVSMSCCCLAAPIFNRTGMPVASISVSTSPEKFATHFEQVRTQVCAQAMDLSFKLGYYSVQSMMGL